MCSGVCTGACVPVCVCRVCVWCVPGATKTRGGFPIVDNKASLELESLELESKGCGAARKTALNLDLEVSCGIMQAHTHMYPPPHMTHVSSSSYDTCILLLISRSLAVSCGIARYRVS